MIINGVEFREAAQNPKSPTQSYAPDGGRTVRVFRNRGNTEADRFASAAALLGYSYAVQETAFGANTDGSDAVRRYIVRRTPHAYPAIAHEFLNPLGKPHMFCTEVPKIEPYGKPIGKDDLDRAVYDWKVMEAAYNTLPYLIKEDGEVPATSGALGPGGGIGVPGWTAKPDEGQALAKGWLSSRYVTRTREYAPKTVTLKHGMPKYVHTDEKQRHQLPEGLAFVQYRIRVTYTWHQVPLAAVPDRAMSELANYVNATDFDFAKAGTLVYVSSKERPTPGPLGDVGRLVDLEHQFLYCPNVDSFFDSVTSKTVFTVMGHNAVPRVLDKKLRWVQISTDGDPAHVAPGFAARNDYFVFKYGDLGRLFRPDQDVR